MLLLGIPLHTRSCPVWKMDTTRHHYSLKPLRRKDSRVVAMTSTRHHHLAACRRSEGQALTIR